MAKTQWILLLSTCFISCASLIIFITSFATNYWIVAEATQDIAIKNSKINYGLFGGSLTRNLLATERNYNLAIVCLYNDNACIYSCQSTHEQRQDELQRILNGVALLECAISRSMPTNVLSIQSTINTFGKIEISPVDDTLTEDQFISPGLWLTTIICLSIASAFAIVAALFALINIIFNPVEPILSILGLYIWNGIASAASVLTLTLWGILFGVVLSENVAITDTLRAEAKYDSNGLATLGFSYWILCCPALLHIVNIGLILWRKKIIEMEPPPPTVNVDKNDFTIMLY